LAWIPLLQDFLPTTLHLSYTYLPSTPTLPVCLPSAYLRCTPLPLHLTRRCWFRWPALFCRWPFQRLIFASCFHAATNIAVHSRTIRCSRWFIVGIGTAFLSLFPPLRRGFDAAGLGAWLPAPASPMPWRGVLRHSGIRRTFAGFNALSTLWRFDAGFGHLCGLAFERPGAAPAPA